VEWNGRDFGQLAKALNDGVDALGRDIIAGLPDASR
jgi:hypothetical protein